MKIKFDTNKCTCIKRHRIFKARLYRIGEGSRQQNLNRKAAQVEQSTNEQIRRKTP